MKISLLNFKKLLLTVVFITITVFGTNAQNISSIAGTGIPAFSGDGGAAISARIYSLHGQLAKDASGNIYIADSYNHRVRKIDISTGVITTIAGTGVAGFSGDGGTATSARLNFPFGVAVDASGNVYISDFLNNRIRKVSTAGIISTICGTGAGMSFGDGSAPISAAVNQPSHICLDGTGNLYITEYAGNRIRRIIFSTNKIFTYCGTGAASNTGNGGSALSATCWNPFSIACDASDNIYFASYTTGSSGAQVRKITPGGIVSAFAGNGITGFSGDGGAATAANISNAQGISVNDAGEIFFSDNGNNRVRKVSTTGIISTYAGNGGGGFSGDGGLATSAQVPLPDGLVNFGCRLYISSSGGTRIRRVDGAFSISVSSGSICSGSSYTIIPSGAISYTYAGGSAIVTPTVTKTYTVIGSDIAGCVSSVATSTVTVNTTPTITVNSGTICSGQSFTINPIGAVSYTYQGGSNIVSPSSFSTYTVIGGSAAGCLSNIVTSSVTVNTTPTITVNSGTICIGQTFTMIPSGASSYTYQGGSATVNPIVSKTYTVIGSTAGCVSSAVTSSVTIGNPTITVNSGTICLGQSFTLNPSGAVSYTYEGGSAIVTPTTTKTYTVIGSSLSGCISSVVTSTVTVVANPTITVNSGTICSGQSFTMNPSGAVSYTYQGGSAIVSPLSLSTYTVIGSSGPGCISSAVTSTVAVNTTPTITVNSGTICSGQSFTMIPSGAGAISFTYAGGSAVVSPTVTKTYTVIGSSGAGCISSAVTSTVTVNTTPTITVNSGTICSGQSFTMIPGGAVSYTYQGGSPIVSPIISTTYSVIGSSAAGCVSSLVTSTVVVSGAAIPTISVNSGSICSGNSFTMSPSGLGIISYTYQGGSAIVSPSSSTTYTVAGSNAAGCVSSAVTSTVTVNTTPTITVNSGTICSGNSFTINPSGAISYTYAGGSAIVSPTVTKTYTVIGSSAAGCISSAVTSTVTISPNPTITVNSGSICAGNSFTLNPSGAVSYTYAGGSAVVTPTTTKTYTVIGSNAIGCVSSVVTSTVTVIANPTITVNSGTICSGKSFTMNPSGAVSYTYQGGSSVVSPLSLSTYTVIGKNASGCISSVVTSTVTVNTTPTITVNSGTICSGNSFTINPSGAISYTYAGGSAVVTPTTTKTYTVIGSSAAGCISSAVTSTVTISPNPTITVNSGSICAGNSFTLNPSGAVSYTYAGGSAVVTPTTTKTYTVIGSNAIGCLSSIVTSTVTVIANPTITVNSGTICSGNSFTMNPSGAVSYTYQGGSAVVSPLSSSTYTVIGKNASGCISSVVTSTVTVNTTPTITVNSGTICSGNSFTMVPSGVGAISFTYAGGSAVVSPTVTKTYTVIGSSAAGCVSSAVTSTVTVNTTPTITVNSGTICSGQSFTMNPLGASSYTYEGGSAIVSPTISTTYTVIGSSAAGCVSSSVTSSLTVNTTPTITVNSGSICAGQSFTMSPSGAPSFTFEGGSAAVSPTITSTYTVNGTSLAGCVSANVTSTVTVFSIPTLTVNNGSICSGQSFTMNPAGAISYTYSSGSDVVYPYVSTNYTVTGINAAGCTNTIVSMVNVSPSPTITATASPSIICTGEVASITVTGASSYLWNTGETTSVITNTFYTSAFYSVVGTDENGCRDTVNVDVEVSQCTGIASQNSNLEFLLYPNPNKGEFTIILSNGLEKTIDILNVTGKIIFTQVSSEDKTPININELASGIYFVKITCNHESKMIKMIKE